MDSDLAVQMTMAQLGETQSAAQMMMLKMQHQMDMDLAQMIEEAIQPAPPPPGQGLVVDKTA
jgi:hypothetical protein